MGSTESRMADLPITWGNVYPCFLLGLWDSETSLTGDPHWRRVNPHRLPEIRRIFDFLTRTLTQFRKDITTSNFCYAQLASHRRNKWETWRSLFPLLSLIVPNRPGDSRAGAAPSLVGDFSVLFSSRAVGYWSSDRPVFVANSSFRVF